MHTLLSTIEIPYYAIVDFALGAPRAATFSAAAAIAVVAFVVVIA